MKALISQLMIGLLFGTGLVVSGMYNPAKVMNFLDIAAITTGQWDPSLIFVMGGGVMVTFFGFRWLQGREQPLLANNFHWPTKTVISQKLVVGSALFGIGWGMAGLCPGPAITAITNPSGLGVLFVIAMLIGFFASIKIER